jgi:hypothetical protein
VAIAVAVVAAFCVAGAARGAGLYLAPHHAVYKMTLATTRPGSGIVGADGTMSYKFADACSGWIVENRIAITYAYSEGTVAATTTDFVTWEAKDGLRYRFRLRNTRDGRVTDDIEGTARLRPGGRGGVAKFTRPQAVTMRLPPGTEFPTAQTVELMRAARAGRRSLLRTVFDGSDTDGPYAVNALIAQPAQRTRPDRHIGGAGAYRLLHTRSWPMRLAFFPLDDQVSVPDFEMAINYHANGVAQSVTQSFKDFSLRGTLEHLTALRRPHC